MEIEVLGRPAVRVGGERVEVTGRQPALLAALVLAAPQPVASDTLLDAVWGDALPRDPANALQQRISALRQVVGRDGGPELLVTVPGGYALRITDDAVDARRFTREVAEAHELLLRDELEEATQVLERALSRWRGEAYEGFGDEPWLTAEVQRLRELRLRAWEDRAEARLRRGDGAELIPELTELVSSEPLRERIRGQLMRALYQAGRQADALAEFARTRELLAEELGVDPGPELQRLHLQVLDQADELEVTAVAASRRRRTTNLPVATTPVIGRETAIEQTQQLLAAGRLVTLTGPGGAGKTTLALEVARREPVPPDGTWLVELAPLQDGAALAATVATAVGLDRGALTGDENDLAPVVAALADRALLLVLDNAEHVVDDVARLAGALLGQAASVQLIVTSREALGVAGELVWSLPPLGLPDAAETEPSVAAASPAIDLLVHRVRQHDPTFALTPEQVPAAVSVVRRLDGIPLAIELAAARVRVLSLPELATALEDRFMVLTSSGRGVPSRQRTLRATIDASWELLDEDLQAAWAAFAVPVERLDRDLAQRLLAAAGVDREPLDVLTDLVDRSLLIAQTASAGTRLRMLESLRAYGQERLGELGLDGAVRRGHREAVRQGIAACHDDGRPGDFGTDLPGLATWLGEARVALATAVAQGELAGAQELAGGLGWLWLLRGYAHEGIGWLDAGLGARDGAPPEDLDVQATVPAALLWASGLRTSRGSAHGLAWAELSIAASATEQQRVLAELFAGVHRAHAGDVDAALAELHHAVERASATGGWLLGFAHLVTAQIGRVAGRLETVRQQAEAGLALLRDPAVGWARAQALDIAIDVIDPVAEPTRARELATEGLALCRRAEVPELEGRMLLQLGVAVDAQGDRDLAASYLDEAVRLTERAGRGPSLGFALLVAGALARDRGELAAAVRQLSDARELLRGTAMGYGAARAALELGRTRQLTGEPEAAAALVEEGLALAAQVGDRDLLAALERLAADL